MSAITSATILDLVPGTDQAIDNALNWFNELNRNVRRLAEALAAHLHAESVSAVRAAELRNRITQRVLLSARDLYDLLLIVGEQVSPAVSSAESERAVVCALELGLAVNALRKNCTVKNGMAVNDSHNALKPEWKYLAQLLATAKEEHRRRKSRPKPEPLVAAHPRQTAPAKEETVGWTTADGPAQWAKLFGISPATLKRRLKEGSIRHRKLSPKSYQIAIDDLPAKHQAKFRDSPLK